MNSISNSSIDAYISLCKEFVQKHAENSQYSALVVRDILSLLGKGPGLDPELDNILQQVPEQTEDTLSPEINLLKNMQEEQFRREIIDFYIPRQLIDAIIANGGIPRDSIETQIGVGFIDVADYTFLAKFLSPKENQILLNGLYTAFANILQKHGGYLNKIEGDSIMFHFGGLIDPKVKDLSSQEALKYISSELFFTCVEMQKTCDLFNEANPDLIEQLQNPEEKEAVKSAFEIIHFMRNDAILANSFNALFQIRIRIGANIGEVSIGNFGPPGNKRWDVIGIAVIDAKRMESTAPVGGLRISEAFYNILNENGIVEKYYQEFKKEAIQKNGYFKEITKDELFHFSSVILKDKKNVTFRTYSVQVNPSLPESIQEQINLLLYKGDIGAEKIVELTQYYRGNRHVIQAIEDLFIKKKINIRKGRMIFYMFPKRYRQFLQKMNNDPNKIETYAERRYQLFDLLHALGNYQDQLKLPPRALEQSIVFHNYDQYMNEVIQHVNYHYKRTIRNAIHNTYFFNVIFPLVFKSIKGSILEYQQTKVLEEALETTILEGEEELESLEKIEAI
ncbi:MAG TPA: adenylate/guanylate cyclase domain-containing protein [Spirochaetales bacterium]|nr:adenylate/guanylate cyclase domain-containing protein [Spirochaetales bacterium]